MKEKQKKREENIKNRMNNKGKKGGVSLKKIYIYIYIYFHLKKKKKNYNF